MSLFTIEGTWEEIELRKAEFVGRQLRLTVKEAKPAISEAASTARRSALGKYAFVSGSSEYFANEKQAEIEREDRSRR